MLELLGKVKVGIWQFWRLVGSMNREYPYHDYAFIESSAPQVFYVVGSNQQAAHGSQHKLFASKSTLIWSDEDTWVRFNNSNNVTIDIWANTWYEFKSNIEAVYYLLPSQGKKLCLYFEGVLPEEARDPE